MQAHGVELHRNRSAMLEERALAADVHPPVFVQAYEIFGDFSERECRRGIEP